MSYIEDSDRHSLYLQRLASGLLKTRVYPSLDEAYRAARLILLDAGEIRNLKQLNAILRKVDSSTVKITAAALDEVTKELQAISVYEASYYAALVGGSAGASLSVPGKKTIQDFIDSALMSLTSGERVTAGLWGEFIGNQIASTGATYNNAIKASFVNGESVSQGIKRLREATQGLLRREYETLVRTGLQHYAINAREAMAQDNLDILEKRYYNTVFDNRRSLLCAGRSGRTWLLTDDSYPRLPAHFNCRSSWIFLLKGQDAPSGTMAAVGGKDGEEARKAYERRNQRLNDLREERQEMRDENGKVIETPSQVRYRGKKDTNIFDPGQISAKTGVDSWLRDQPEWYVRDTLGETRAKLFLDGKLPINSFTDATGRTLTLKELAERDAAAFARAGIAPKG